MNFSNNLRILRREKNITQKQLASYLCLSRSTIAGYETKSHQPDFATLEKLATYFEVSIDYLITGEEKLRHKDTTVKFNQLPQIKKCAEHTLSSPAPHS